MVGRCWNKGFRGKRSLTWPKIVQPGASPGEFGFGDSKNCPTGQAPVNSDVEFSPGHFDILCVFFRVRMQPQIQFDDFATQFCKKSRNSCLLILIKTRWHNTWAPQRILFFGLLSFSISFRKTEKGDPHWGVWRSKMKKKTRVPVDISNRD